MSYKNFSVDIDDRVAHVVLTRPHKRNSMDPAFWRELPEIIAISTATPAPAPS